MSDHTLFDRLAGDERRIGIDCDVTVGHWPPRADVVATPTEIARLLQRGSIDSALVTSAMAIWFDEARGNAELVDTAATHRWHPCPAVNLRDAWRFEERLDRWLSRGVRAVRLPGVTQQVAPSSPGYESVVRLAAERGVTLLVEGAFTAVQRAFRGIGAKVVFCDVSYYESGQLGLSTGLLDVADHAGHELSPGAVLPNHCSRFAVGATENLGIVVDCELGGVDSDGDTSGASCHVVTGEEPLGFPVR